MATLREDAVMVAGLAVAAIVIAYYLKKKVEGAAAAVADQVAEVWDVASTAADNAVSKPVLGIGDALGVPRTNMTECERAKLDGRTWDASFACPAGDFLGYVFN